MAEWIGNYLCVYINTAVPSYPADFVPYHRLILHRAVHYTIIIMVNITASLTALLAIASLTAAAPTSLEPQSDIPTHIFEKRAVDCRDDNFNVWKRGNVRYLRMRSKFTSSLTDNIADCRRSQMYN
jgi:hypothetical protein